MINELKFEDKMLAAPLLEDEAEITFHDVDRKRVKDLLNQLRNNITHLRSCDSDKIVEEAIDNLFEGLDELLPAIKRYRNELKDTQLIQEFDDDDKWQIEKGMVTYNDLV